jgi:hypothetical protein
MVDNERASNALFWSNAGDVEPTIVLFSGGRDSTLAAVRCLLAGAYLVLCVFDTGFGLSRELIDVRINELRTSVGAGRFDVAHIPVYGLVRTV